MCSFFVFGLEQNLCTLTVHPVRPVPFRRQRFRVVRVDGGPGRSGQVTAADSENKTRFLIKEDTEKVWGVSGVGTPLSGGDMWGRVALMKK